MHRAALTIAAAAALTGCGGERIVEREIRVMVTPTPTVVGPARYPGLPVFCYQATGECWQAGSRVTVPKVEGPCERSGGGPSRVWLSGPIVVPGPEGIDDYLGQAVVCEPID